MSYATKCRNCFYAVRCQWLLGPSYNPDGKCDWDPSRYVHIWNGQQCPACEGKRGHQVGCEYVANVLQHRKEQP